MLNESWYGSLVILFFLTLHASMDKKIVIYLCGCAYEQEYWPLIYGYWRQFLIIYCGFLICLRSYLHMLII
jgi:hypothetical protein